MAYGQASLTAGTPPRPGLATAARGGPGGRGTEEEAAHRPLAAAACRAGDLRAGDPAGGGGAHLALPVSGALPLRRPAWLERDPRTQRADPLSPPRPLRRAPRLHPAAELPVPAVGARFPHRAPGAILPGADGVRQPWLYPALRREDPGRPDPGELHRRDPLRLSPPRSPLPPLRCGAPPGAGDAAVHREPPVARRQRAQRQSRGDRKSTRLNSSHVRISYAVFCLKK